MPTPETTDWRPRALPLTLAACLTLGLFVDPVRAADAGPGADQDANDASEPTRFLAHARKKITGLTNKFRRDQGEPPLATNEMLIDTARDFAAFMARTGQYGHQADGQTPAARARAHGYDLCLIAENIGWQQIPTEIEPEALAAAFVDGWKDSPGHRANMLIGAAREIGAALSESQRSGRFYAVQLLGRPASMSTEFRIINDARVDVTYSLGEREYRLPPRLRRTHQICKPSPLRVQWPNGQEAAAVTPEDGQQFHIMRDAAGELHLREE